jgi:hypothetical protein
MGACGLDWSGWGQGQVAASCEHGNEPSDSIKYWDIHDQLSFSRQTLLSGVK